MDGSSQVPQVHQDCHAGLPSSSSHALIGGFVGGGVIGRGWSLLEYGPIIQEVVLPLSLLRSAGFAADSAVLAWFVTVPASALAEPSARSCSNCPA